jgi:hypothetical protein
MVRYRDGNAEEVAMPENKPLNSDDAVPQSDKQRQTDIAQHEGQEGAQAKVINQKEAEKRQNKQD